MTTNTTPSNHSPAALPPGAPAHMAEGIAVSSQSIPPRQHRHAPGVTLRKDFLACYACGVATRNTLDADSVFLDVIEVEGFKPLPPDRDGFPRVMRRLETLLCSACEDRYAALRAHAPNPTAAAKSEIASDLLAVLGVAPNGPISNGLIKASAEFGAKLRWAARFVPVMHDKEDAGRCSPHAWAHVNDDLRIDLRKTYAAHLAETVARHMPPVALTPPVVHETNGINGGCLFCGVRSVEVPAAHVAREGGKDRAADKVWRHLAANPSVLGGLGDPQQFTGHCCPDCSKALDGVGAIGMTALERALRRYLVATGRDVEAAQVVDEETSGLMAWGALVHMNRRRGERERRPSAEPWAHMRVSVPSDPEDEELDRLVRRLEERRWAREAQVKAENEGAKA